jgi:rubrerythrin
MKDDKELYRDLMECYREDTSRKFINKGGYKRGKNICIYCGSSMQGPTNCPYCGFGELRYKD